MFIGIDNMARQTEQKEKMGKEQISYQMAGVEKNVVNDKEFFLCFTTFEDHGKDTDLKKFAYYIHMQFKDNQEFKGWHGDYFLAVDLYGGQEELEPEEKDLPKIVEEQIFGKYKMGTTEKQWWQEKGLDHTDPHPYMAKIKKYVDARKEEEI